MATQTTIVAQTEDELIYELAKYLYVPKKSDFSPVGKGTVYDFPVISKKNVSFNGRNYTGKEGIIQGLDFPQQIMLLDRLSQLSGIQFRQLTLRENFDAAYSPEGQKYKENVLALYRVFTGEMIRKLPDDKYTVHRIKSVEKETVSCILNDYLLAEGEQLIPSRAVVVRVYKAGPVLQAEIPTEFGFFDDFIGVIPVDSEIGKGRKGYWGGVGFDENNLSAVECFWNHGVQYLDAGAGGPLYYIGVLGIGIDAPL